MTRKTDDASIDKDRKNMKKLMEKIFGQRKKETKKHDFEWEKFQVMAKEQFKRLKDKGLTIPIATF